LTENGYLEQVAFNATGSAPAIDKHNSNTDLDGRVLSLVFFFSALLCDTPHSFAPNAWH